MSLLVTPSPTLMVHMASSSFISGIMCDSLVSFMVLVSSSLFSFSSNSDLRREDSMLSTLLNPPDPSIFPSSISIVELRV